MSDVLSSESYISMRDEALNAGNVIVVSESEIREALEAQGAKSANLIDTDAKSFNSMCKTHARPDMKSAKGAYMDEEGYWHVKANACGVPNGCTLDMGFLTNGDGFDKVMCRTQAIMDEFSSLTAGKGGGGGGRKSQTSGNYNIEDPGLVPAVLNGRYKLIKCSAPTEAELSTAEVVCDLKEPDKGKTQEGLAKKYYDFIMPDQTVEIPVVGGYVRTFKVSVPENAKAKYELAQAIKAHSAKVSEKREVLKNAEKPYQERIDEIRRKRDEEIKAIEAEMSAAGHVQTAQKVVDDIKANLEFIKNVFVGLDKHFETVQSLKAANPIGVSKDQKSQTAKLLADKSINVDDVMLAKVAGYRNKGGKVSDINTAVIAAAEYLMNQK